MLTRLVTKYTTERHALRELRTFMQHAIISIYRLEAQHACSVLYEKIRYSDDSESDTQLN